MWSKLPLTGQREWWTEEKDKTGGGKGQKRDGKRGRGKGEERTGSKITRGGYKERTGNQNESRGEKTGGRVVACVAGGIVGENTSSPFSFIFVASSLAHACSQAKPTRYAG